MGGSVWFPSFPKRDHFCFFGFIFKSLASRLGNSALQLLYHTELRLSGISHISVTLGDPSTTTASQTTSPHQLDPIKLQPDNMSVNHRGG